MANIDNGQLYAIQDQVLDIVGNILSNKLSAVIGRNNPKDKFDIYSICHFYSFSWKDILQSAHEKAGFGNEDLIIRLKSFPVSLFSQIKVKDFSFLNDFEKRLPQIVNEIVKEEEHNAWDSKPG